VLITDDQRSERERKQKAIVGAAQLGGKEQKVASVMAAVFLQEKKANKACTVRLNTRSSWFFAPQPIPLSRHSTRDKKKPFNKMEHLPPNSRNACKIKT
jgi:hypothetical protein